jgi:hypothetical protein
MHDLPPWGWFSPWRSSSVLSWRWRCSFMRCARIDPSVSHGWLVVVPLLIIAGWILETLIMG